MKSLKVLLADDHPLFRAGLKNALEPDPMIEIVGEASRGEEALRLTGETGPDLVLLDVNMPGMDGIETTRQIKARYPHIKVIILTMYSDDAYWRESMEVGASGYILKRAVDTELRIAIRTVMDGENYLYPTLVGGLKKIRQESPAVDIEEEVLSPREKEVLMHIALGHTQQEIADRLFVSVKTVDSYKTRIKEKLGANKRSDLVRYALKHNIISEKTV